ncbi:glycosyltransferase family 4 protein [Paenibacillus sp. GD4]|jgi:glycosyltransferase involved in cell wall biosynthesis|uniref:glycosyltransferase family 4 protein n=1 Tax=Paenibacillus sp. GD4 TaxID=3068890 RepID=UPI0027964E35|nr:glycosyltransferase family 4 protein [Paenibacillus sp. GD4]MDQ1910404.1 glycosyltransferase family 4 protein [Paenibacillus sp. GD4]
MRIAIVMPLADLRGGAEIMLLHLLRANRQAALIDYSLAFFEDGPLAREAEALGYRVQVFEAGKLRQAGRYARTVKLLYAWLKQEGADAVLSWMSKAHLYAGPAAVLAKVPALWYQHGIAGEDLLEKCYGYIPSKAVLCPSTAALKHQKRVTPRLSAAVIHPSVDLQAYFRVSHAAMQKTRKELGLPEGKRILGLVARLQRWKGVHTFLDAAAKLARRHEDVHFVVVGGEHYSEPDYPTELRRQAQQAGMESRITFAGHQPDSARWVRAFDVLVHASLEEPFGMVIIEGMASGKPVIASKAGGPLETITHGVNGLLVPPGDAAGLASSMERLIADPEEYRRLSEAGYMRAQDFGTERLAKEVAALCQTICGSREMSIDYERP